MENFILLPICFQNLSLLPCTCLLPILAAFLISSSSFFSSLSSSLLNLLPNYCGRESAMAFSLRGIFKMLSFFPTFCPSQHPGSPCAGTYHLLSAGLPKKRCRRRTISFTFVLILIMSNSTFHSWCLSKQFVHS